MIESILLVFITIAISIVLLMIFLPIFSVV